MKCFIVETIIFDILSDTLFLDEDHPSDLKSSFEFGVILNQLESDSIHYPDYNGTAPGNAIVGGCGKKAKVIRVATDITWPPFESVSEQTKDIEGFDIDLMNTIAEKENLETDFVNVAWDPLLTGMVQCQYDAAISAMTITEERMEQFLFSDAYFAAGQIVTVQKANADINSKVDLDGKVVGVQSGTTGSFEVERIASAILKTYDDIGLAMQDLMNGQINAVIADKLLALEYVVRNPTKLKTADEAFTDENYGIAICRTNRDLQAKINSGLEAIIAEGLIDELIEKRLSSD